MCQLEEGLVSNWSKEKRVREKYHYVCFLLREVPENHLVSQSPPLMPEETETQKRKITFTQGTTLIHIWTGTKNQDFLLTPLASRL